MRQFALVAWALLAGIAPSLGSPPPNVRAHGGGTPQLIDVRAGPYALWVWTDPDPLRVGQMHVSVAVAEPETQAPILDAQVTVQIELPGEGTTPLTADATGTAAANKLLYVAILEPPVEGQWLVTVSVAGPAGSGWTDFEVPVLPPRPVNWGLIGGAGLGLLTIGWTVWMLGRQKPDE